MLLFLQRGLVMFLNLNKKKLKELSNSKLSNLNTNQIRGGNCSNTDAPSRTSHTRCEIEVAEKITG